MDDDSTYGPSGRRGHGRSQVVPHIEVCPACGGPIVGRSCKMYCTNPGCELCGRVVENCAGD